MTSLTGRAAHSADLCHGPHRLEKCNGKGHFPSHCFEPFKNSPKSPQDREKEGDSSFCAFATDSKAQPCKIRGEFGGRNPAAACLFHHRKAKEDSLSSPCVPNTHNGLCPPFMLQTEAGMGR